MTILDLCAEREAEERRVACDTPPDKSDKSDKSEEK